jgi:hypothetical protein
VDATGVERAIEVGIDTVDAMVFVTPLHVVATSHCQRPTCVNASPSQTAGHLGEHRLREPLPVMSHHRDRTRCAPLEYPTDRVTGTAIPRRSISVSTTTCRYRAEDHLQAVTAMSGTARLFRSDDVRRPKRWRVVPDRDRSAASTLNIVPADEASRTRNAAADGRAPGHATVLGNSHPEPLQFASRYSELGVRGKPTARLRT